MLDNHLLTELVTFAQLGTLAKTADKLHLTQPAVTQGLKKLEQAWGVQLFQHQPNKLYLTETGKFAARLAKQVLDAQTELFQKVVRYDQNLRAVIVGANAPGPMIVVRSLARPNWQLIPQIIADNFEERLFQRQATCLLLNHPLQEHGCRSVYLGTESLSINLPATSPLAKQNSLHFKDLHGQTIMSPSGIGFWQQIYQERIPAGKFIFQSQSSDYSEILNYSSLPYFTTNLTALDDQWGKHLPNNRIIVPIADPIAHQQFYACFLTSNHERLQPLINALQDRWAQVDAS